MLPEFIKPVVHKFRKYYIPYLVPNPGIDPEFKMMNLPELVQKSDTVVEVGARTGAATVHLSKLAKFVYAFEPNPECFEFLRQYAKRIGNVEAFNFGLWNEETKLALGVNFKLDGDASFLERSETSLIVKVRSLDSFGLEPTVIIFDCKGSEFEVLDGAAETLKAVRCIIIETTYITRSSPAKLLELRHRLETLGFSNEKSVAEGRGSFDVWTRKPTAKFLATRHHGQPAKSSTRDRPAHILAPVLHT